MVHLFIGISWKNSSSIMSSLLSLDQSLHMVTYYNLSNLFQPGIYCNSNRELYWKEFDSYGISVLKNTVLNHCGIKTKRVCILGEVGRDVNTVSIREKHLQKVAEEVKKLWVNP